MRVRRLAWADHESSTLAAAMRLTAGFAAQASEPSLARITGGETLASAVDASAPSGSSGSGTNDPAAEAPFPRPAHLRDPGRTPPRRRHGRKTRDGCGVEVVGFEQRRRSETDRGRFRARWGSWRGDPLHVTCREMGA